MQTITERNASALVSTSAGSGFSSTDGAWARALIGDKKGARQNIGVPLIDYAAAIRKLLSKQAPRVCRHSDCYHSGFCGGIEIFASGGLIVRNYSDVQAGTVLNIFGNMSVVDLAYQVFGEQLGLRNLDILMHRYSGRPHLNFFDFQVEDVGKYSSELVGRDFEEELSESSLVSYFQVSSAALTEGRRTQEMIADFTVWLRREFNAVIELKASAKPLYIIRHEGTVKLKHRSNGRFSYTTAIENGIEVLEVQNANLENILHLCLCPQFLVGEVALILNESQAGDVLFSGRLPKRNAVETMEQLNEVLGGLGLTMALEWRMVKTLVVREL